MDINHKEVNVFNQLLEVNVWALDLAFFLLLLLGTVLGSFRGFIKGVAKLTGKLFSLIFAFTFCIAFANFLENCFGMTSAITSGIAGSIAKDAAYAAEIPTSIAGSELNNVLNGMGIGFFPRWMISISFKSVALIPAGTTPAMLIASVLAKWISIVIGFIGLIIIMRVGVALIAKILSAFIEKVAPLKVINRFLGALLGFTKSLLFVLILLGICRLLPIESLHTFIESSNVVGLIFKSEWFHNLMSYAVSGEWFTRYLSKLSI